MNCEKKVEVWVKRCSKCNESGYIEVDSHDCWGKYESYKRCCSSCGGNGFIILNPSKIKEVLK